MYHEEVFYCQILWGTGKGFTSLMASKAEKWLHQVVVYPDLKPGPHLYSFHAGHLLATPRKTRYYTTHKYHCDAFIIDVLQEHVSQASYTKNESISPCILLSASVSFCVSVVAKRGAPVPPAPVSVPAPV